LESHKYIWYKWAIGFKIAEVLGEDTIIFKKINLRVLLEDAIEKAKSIDLDKLERELDEGSNQLARQKFKVSSR
jgi:hypothetical protein